MVLPIEHATYFAEFDSLYNIYTDQNTSMVTENFIYYLIMHLILSECCREKWVIANLFKIQTYILLNSIEKILMI